MSIDANWLKCDKLTVDKTKYSGTVNTYPAHFVAANLNPDIFTDAKAGGADIRFTSDAAGANELAFEINIWDAANTACVIFVNVGTITTSTNPIIYMWYKNPAASAYAETDTYGKHNTWDANFLTVQHLTENGTAQAIDSTSNSRDSTARTATSTQTIPLFYRSASFVAASSHYINYGDVLSLAASACTVESWSNTPVLASGNMPILSKLAQYFQLIGWNTGGSYWYNDITLYASGAREAYVIGVSLNVWNYDFGSFPGHPGTIANWNNLNAGITIASTAAIVAGSNDFFIGYRAPIYYGGKIQEVRISNIQRSTAYREATYNNISAPATFSAWEEVVLVPSTPVLASPADNTVGAPINQTVTWNASAGATSYDLQVDDDSGFGSPLINLTGITDLFYATSGLANSTKYYWRVRAVSGGGTSAWATAWNFTTILATPTLSSPTSGTTGAPVNQTVTWNAVAGATSYALQVDDDPAFGSPLVNVSGLTDLFYALSGLPNYTTYYWRVNATNGGGTTAWATAWNFRTIIAAPVPASPANGATFVPNPTVFTWSAPTGATGYRLQIATDVGFLNIVHDDAALVAATATVGGLISGTTYFWRVLASHGAEVSAWSTIFFFSRGSQVILNVPYGKLILVSNGVSKWTILVP